MTTLSLQERYAPHGICFGCGCINEQGLRIKSYVRDEGVVCDWTPSAHHEAFPGMLNGGIIGSIFDCHCNWTAAWHLMNQGENNHPPCTVTAEFTVKLRRPTPSHNPVHLVAHVVDIAAGHHVAQNKTDRVVVEAVLSVDGVETASCRGIFVAVKPGHPAYHRW